MCLFWVSFLASLSSRWYVVKDLAYNLILGKPWMEHNDVIYLSAEAKPFDSVARNTVWWYAKRDGMEQVLLIKSSQGGYDPVYEDDHRLPFLSGSKQSS